ncbi:DUF5935 domain-containing protein [Aurantiacibacter flavus]|uniref:DUF5935 domain-containing protein n=1 Tax=Aurantiacibacter flavus TaxID=3145232 RepID=A0ABV0CYY5_9SPHN
MVDLVLLAFIGLIAAMGLKRPFVWILLYIYVDLVIPQKVGWGIIQMFPLSLMMFALAFGGWLVLDSKEGSRFTFRQGLIVALLGLCAFTTFRAEFQDSAWEKWDWVWKSLLFAAFLPLTMRTRLRIEAVALFMVLSIGAICISGGMKTVFGGGGYGTLRLLVVENSGIYESSIISIAAIAIIPIAVWLARFGTVFRPHWTVAAFVAALSFACLLMPVGTNARTGLVCAAVLAAMMLRTVKNRFLYAGIAGVALVMAVPFLPQSYLERMSTIFDHKEDESASTRIAVWGWTLDYVKEHPMGGGFDAYRANSFTYQMPQVTGSGNSRSVTYVEVTDEGRAYHSSYFEMLGEQGWLGLGLWLLLHGIGLLQMELVRRRFRPAKGEKLGWQGGLAEALQQAHVVFMIGALFVGIAFQPFGFLIVGMEIAFGSYLKRQAEEQRQGPSRRWATSHAALSH